ncbi:hypothetical protein SAMN05216464_108164 [Mucilaginibacter pineti]|uniref:Uncharacterized protein n=1 Tax=Mucilaginibacter pineti TaxID=1391627 RepID=A0A1G7EU91_9SPHI|nr:hypothetical protein [Mucilaginibacter pineti]SDE67273.1 hypothetical protein SAMN05216464_108164 [Mucilaginibacter pineti]
MAEAAIFFDGKVRQTTNLSNITFNNKTGFVTNFTFNKIKYTHVLKDRFISDGINTTNANNGYYDESVFLKYLAKDGVSINGLTAAKLSLNLITSAVKNDTVRVQQLNIVAPYTDFCTLNKYTWNFDPNANVLDDRHFTIILQPGYQLITEKLPLSSVPNDFYAKNISLITSADFTENKDQGAYYLSLIALQIYRINNDVFPLFYQSTELTNYITTQNLEWRTGTIFNQPSLQDLADYYTNLTNFYNSAYANQLVIAAGSEKTKLFWLANCLSPQGLSVFSVYDKVYIITQAILQSKSFALLNVAMGVILPVAGSNLQQSDAGWIARVSPKLILNLVESVTFIETQCDSFLAQLNSIGDWGLSKDETLFEVIYNFLGDNQLGNIIGDNKAGRIIGGIFGNPDDRKNFIKFSYKIWQTSIYNPYYESPTYNLPANGNHVFPESYYMSNSGIEHYNADTASVLFVFETTATADLISYTTSFDYSINRDKIIAYKIEVIKIHDEHQSSETFNVLYGTYDLYQPVAVTGFKTDLDLVMPNANYFPLFFLYYANDYQDVKDADAVLELLFNLALNFTGIGEVTDLGYLMQISKYGELINLPASTELLAWTAKEGVNNAVQFTAGNALAISIYVNDTATDPRLKNFTSYLNIFLGAVLLGSIGYHPLAKQKVTFAAIKVNAEYEALMAAEIETHLSVDAINAVKAFGEVDTIIAAMRTKISNLPLTNTNTILARFDAFTQEEQLSFNYDFLGLNDNVVWDRLNDIYEYQIFNPDGTSGGSAFRTLVDDWSEIRKLKEERGNIDFLIAYQRFKYLEPNEFNHLWFLHGTNGGHRYIYVTTDFDDPILWKIVPNDPNINTTIPTALRTTVTKVNDHTYYRNLWRYNPLSENVETLNGLKISRKTRHFVLDEVWTKQDAIEEMAFGFSRKTEIETVPSLIKYQGNKLPIIIKRYESVFYDGTKLEITVSSQGIDIEGNLKSNYISLFAIKAPIN